VMIRLRPNPPNLKNAASMAASSFPALSKERRMNRLAALVFLAAVVGGCSSATAAAPC